MTDELRGRSTREVLEDHLALRSADRLEDELARNYGTDPTIGRRYDGNR